MFWTPILQLTGQCINSPIECIMCCWFMMLHHLNLQCSSDASETIVADDWLMCFVSVLKPMLFWCWFEWCNLGRCLGFGRLPLWSCDSKAGKNLFIALVIIVILVIDWNGLGIDSRLNGLDSRCLGFVLVRNGLVFWKSLFDVVITLKREYLM